MNKRTIISWGLEGGGISSPQSAQGLPRAGLREAMQGLEKDWPVDGPMTGEELKAHVPFPPHTVS